MQDAGDDAGAEACAHAGRRRQQRRVAADDQRAGHGGAQRQAAVDREVGEVEHPEGDEHAEHHEAVEEALLERALETMTSTCGFSRGRGPGPRRGPGPGSLPRPHAGACQPWTQNLLTALVDRSAGSGDALRRGGRLVDGELQVLGELDRDVA